MKSFEAQILTPDGAVFKGMIESINLPGTEGNFQILAGHASLMTALETGEISINTGATTNTRFAVTLGFAEVHQDKVTVLAEAAEDVVQIDLERAKEALKRAEERVAAATNSEDIDLLRAEAALQRATNRLRLAKG